MAIFTRIFKRKAQAKPPPPVSPAATRPDAGAAQKPKGEDAEEGPAVDPLTPEERCEIDARMSKGEIREQLAKLFRRHNRLASSMDPAARHEAEYMLDLIVQMREKYLD